MDSVLRETERIRNSPYVLITSYNNERVTDYGTYEYIDSIKCIRLAEMRIRAKEIDREDKIRKYKIKLEEERLEKLNEPCQ